MARGERYRPDPSLDRAQVLEGKLGDAGSVPDGRAVFDPVADERLAAERLRYPRRARARQH
jgi:hypothetical protein